MVDVRAVQFTVEGVPQKRDVIAWYEECIDPRDPLKEKVVGENACGATLRTVYMLRDEQAFVSICDEAGALHVASGSGRSVTPVQDVKLIYA